MFEDTAKLLRSELSATNAIRHAHEIHGFERRYSYRNFHKSAAYCAGELRRIGLADVEVIPQPADGVTKYMDCVMPMAWDVKAARLEIASPAGASPRVLADWEQNPFCIAEWSPGTGPAGMEAELVTEEQMRAGADVRGKIVLNSLDHHPRLIKREVTERGGIGVVSDWTENAPDTPDGIYWNNEWGRTGCGWYGGFKDDAENPVWCISLTPRTGTALRRLISTTRSAVRLRAVIRTRLYKGTLDTVTGVIPGTSRRAGEILLVAHLYEPMPSDNATGAAAVLEIARAIQSLVQQGRLPPPRRTVRFVFDQEMHGLSAYLVTRPQVRRRALAALNLDDIAADCHKTGRPISITVNPDVQASFTDPLFKAVARHCFARYAPLLPWQVVRCDYDDNFVSDPTIGIPANRLLSPAGVYHHNSMNDWSIISPEMLHAAMTIYGTFAQFVSSARRREILWLASRIMREARSRLDKIVAEAVSAGTPADGRDAARLVEKVREQLDYARFVEANRLAGLKKLARPGDDLSGYFSTLAGDLDAASREASGRAERAVQALMPRHRLPRKPARRELSNDELVAQNMTPRRKFMGPMVNYHRVPGALQEKVAADANPTAIQWTDGKRNLLEIARMVALESNRDVGNLRPLLRFYRALERYGYMDIRCAVTLTKVDIKKALKRIGVHRNDIIFMHSSLSRCGPIRGGARTLIDALMDVLSPGGTLVMPTNYDNAVIGKLECGETYRYPSAPLRLADPWDPKKSPAYTGAVPNAFRKRRDVLRSAHPTHSVAAWGKLAEEFVRGHGPGTSCCGREGPYGKMVDHGGKFLYFACGLGATTFFHAVETWADLGYMPTVNALMRRGDKVVTVKVLDYPEGDRSFYGSVTNKVTRKMDTLKIKVGRVPLGLSDLKLIEARDLSRLFGVLSDEPDLMLCDRETCRFCVWARKQIAGKRRPRREKRKRP